MNTIIRNAAVVNEGRIVNADILIRNSRIEKIAPVVNLHAYAAYSEINAEGLYALPGIIDAHVHFREPGLTHKGSIYTESRAAVAGGVTSFMDMPNTLPQTITQQLLQQKYDIASQSSLANYSFFMGINKFNLDEVLRIDNQSVCGISDDGLYFDSDEGILANYPDFLEALFSRSNALIALHCEDDAVIRENTERYRIIYGDEIPIRFHPEIRSEESCLLASRRVVALAAKYNTRLHILHVSTSDECDLFENKVPLYEKRITSEACIHHLNFNDSDYDTLGANIKWNPAIKTKHDQYGLMKALLDNRIDIIATDHAPHTRAEKQGSYFSCLSGGPMVQHALPVMLALHEQGKLSLTQIAEKMSHHVAEIYRIVDRGYFREGYFADIALIDMNQQWTVLPHNLHYRCAWSPFDKHIFNNKVTTTIVNGFTVFDRGKFYEHQTGMRLRFSVDR